ncbi:cysteine-rich secretory protein lccl domain-containing 2, partial [Plakobranchus ocellatus]
MDLEALAKTWALERVEGRGENLAHDIKHIAEAELRAFSAQQWFDEKTLYTRGQGPCKKACHYTMLVWDKTEKVGCYSYRCPELNATDKIVKNAWHLVCFYTPWGNLVGDDPYQT